jgi:hypothetical protein
MASATMLERLQNSRNALGYVFMLPAAVLLLGLPLFVADKLLARLKGLSDRVGAVADLCAGFWILLAWVFVAGAPGALGVRAHSRKVSAATRASRAPCTSGRSPSPSPRWAYPLPRPWPPAAKP